MLRHCFALRRFATLHPVVGYALLTLACLVTLWSLQDARQEKRREAERQGANIASALERTIERTATTLDLSLRSATTGMAIPGLSSLPAATRQAILFDGALTAEGIGGISITDEHGQVQYASREDLPQGSRADREYYQIHRDDPGRGLLLTGPVPSRAGPGWTVVLSRRLNHLDGSFAGIVAGGLYLDSFEKVFASLQLDPDTVVVLASAEGRLLARRPPAGGDVGRDLRERPLLRRSANSPSGSFITAMQLDGIERLVVYRQVGDLPLVIGVAFSTRAIYAGWLRNAEIMGLVLVLLGGVDLLLGRALRRELRDRGRAEQAATLARAEAERLAAELSRSLARHEALVNNSADAMVVARVDRLGDFAYEAVNPVWEGLSGVAAADAIGRPPRACLPAAVADVVNAAWEDCVRQRGQVAFSFRSDRTGEERCWDSVVCPVIEADGAIHRVIATTRDVTERRRLEAKLREGNRMEAVGGLTAGIAHDFNNLLQAMLGALEVVKDEAGIDHDVGPSIGIAAEAGRRAASLVHQLLAFSRKQLLRPAPLELGQLAGELAVAMRPMLGNRYRLLTDVAAGSGPVLADAVQLSRCLTDLILNARDAMPHGGPLYLRVQVPDAEAAGAAGLGPGRYVRLVVEDEGVGMPDELLSRVFEPFFTTKGVGQGAGLGLSMVQGFARQSGGDVTIESAPGIGTAVSLWLPEAQEGQTNEQVSATRRVLQRAYVMA